HNLCRLLSRHAERSAKEADEGAVAKQQRRSLHVEELEGFTASLIAVGTEAKLADLFPRSFYRMVSGRDTTNTAPCVAAPAVHYANESERKRYDILQSI